MIRTAALLAALLLTNPLAAQSLEARFAAPPQTDRPWVRWWWPGGAVDTEELDREIGLLDKSGFAGAEIQAFTPNFITLEPGQRAAVNDYAEPVFFEKMRSAGVAAKARGLALDFTLGSSWPSGGGFAVTPELAFVELAMARTAVTGGGPGPVSVQMPKRTRRFGAMGSMDARTRDPRAAGWVERLDARARTVAVVAVKGQAPELKTAAKTAGLSLFPWADVRKSGMLEASGALVLTDRLRDDGTLDWAPPPGEWQVFVFRQFASDVGVLGAAGQGPQLILDHMNPKAFAAHAARVGEPLGQNVPGFRGSFVDSLELMQDIPWGPDFLEQFRKRRGYALVPYLPFVLQPGWMQAWGEHWSPPYFEATDPDLAERVREDYRRTVSELMIEGFIQPFVDWNHRQGLKARFQAHGGAFDILKGYGLADIPETEDLVHGGDPYFMRFARSAAHLYGRPLVSAESFVWKDRPYEVTPDEMRRRVDLVVASGVNHLVLHGMNYRIPGQDWPGWHAFQPSGFSLGFSTMLNESNPIWPAVPALAAYIARLQTVMRAGEAVVPVAYFYGRYGYYVGIEDDGAGEQAAEKAFLSGGYDFDRINPDSLLTARVVKGRLVAKGGQTYAALVLPPIDAMRPDAAEAVARVARAGVPVYFATRVPTRAEGLADAARQDARVRKAVAAALTAGARITPEAEIPAALRAAEVRPNLSYVAGDPTGLLFVQRRVDSRLLSFIHNPTKGARDVTLSFPATGGVSRWNAMDGTSVPVSARAVSGGTEVPLHLRAGESALLLLDPKANAERVPASVVIADVELPEAGWSLAVDGHSARMPFARDLGSVRLADWRDVPELRAFAGRATYRRTVEIDPAWLQPGTQVHLNLGPVHDMARVSVNGMLLPPLIDEPFRARLTGLLKPGRNELAIDLYNVPQNAMIDAKAPGFKALKPVAAGLPGPVRLEVSR